MGRGINSRTDTAPLAVRSFISILNFVVATLNYFYRFLEFKNSLVGILFLPILAIFYTWRVHNLNKAQESLFSSEPVKVGRSTVNNRMIWTLFSVIDIATVYPYFVKSKYKAVELVVFCGFSLGMFIYYYFAEIKPLPPGRSKLRDWIEKFVGLFQKAPEPQTIPVESG